MKTRINLTVEAKLIDQIKAYAEGKNTSVSELVEGYFRRLTKPVKKNALIDLIESLPKPQIDDNVDLKKQYYEERASTHGV